MFGWKSVSWLAGRMGAIVHFGRGFDMLLAKAVILRCGCISPFKKCGRLLKQRKETMSPMSWGPDVEHCRPSLCTQIQQYDINVQFLRAKEVHAESQSSKKSGDGCCRKGPKC